MIDAVKQTLETASRERRPRILPVLSRVCQTGKCARLTRGAETAKRPERFIALGTGSSRLHSLTTEQKRRLPHKLHQDARAEAMLSGQQPGQGQRDEQRASLGSEPETLLAIPA